MSISPNMDASFKNELYSFLLLYLFRFISRPFNTNKLYKLQDISLTKLVDLSWRIFISLVSSKLDKNLNQHFQKFVIYTPTIASIA